VTGDHRQHQRAEVELRRVVEIGASGDEHLDCREVAGVGGAHQGRLTMSISRVDVVAGAHHLRQGADVASSRRLLPTESDVQGWP
jgi:hypothetical protein